MNQLNITYLALSPSHTNNTNFHKIIRYKQLEKKWELEYIWVFKMTRVTEFWKCDKKNIWDICTKYESEESWSD